MREFAKWKSLAKRADKAFLPPDPTTAARTQTQLHGKKRKASGGESLKIVFKEQVFREKNQSGVATGGCFQVDGTEISKVKIDSNRKEHGSGKFIYRNC